MESEDVDKLLDIATKSRLHSVLVGVLLMAIGIVFFVLGVHAVVLEIIVTGIIMMVSGVTAVMEQGVRSIEGIPMIILGALFVVLSSIFETIHGIILFLEFLTTGVVYLAAAFGYRERKYSRRRSLVIGAVALYVAVCLLVAHEESMDVLVTILGAVLMALSVYVLWCAARNRPVVNPLPKEEP